MKNNKTLKYSNNVLYFLDWNFLSSIELILEITDDVSYKMTSIQKVNSFEGRMNLKRLSDMIG
jgi:hypothetical protein